MYYFFTDKICKKVQIFKIKLLNVSAPNKIKITYTYIDSILFHFLMHEFLANIIKPYISNNLTVDKITV